MRWSTKVFQVFGYAVFVLILEPLFAQSQSCPHFGCSAPPLVDKKPFVVVWNHPTSRCEKRGINLDLQKWGIIENERDQFLGQKIVIFYNLGKWPFYSKGKQFNGGLPQRADFAGHRAKTAADVKATVRNNTFQGLAVIDMELWRPLLRLNWDSLKIYQEESLALAKKRFPKFNSSQLWVEATREFEAAARELMGSTLEQVTSERAGGRWGYYGFPRCWDNDCNSSTIDYNNQLGWIYGNSSGIYPSIYFNMATSKSQRQLAIKYTLKESFRVKAMYSPQDSPVLPYAKCQQGPYGFFNLSNLSLAIGQPANMGASGVVLWGSSFDVEAKNECVLLKAYINNTLGPYVRNLTDFFGNCSQQLCAGHGRCVRKDYEAVHQTHLREAGRQECLLPLDELLTPELEAGQGKMDARSFGRGLRQTVTSRAKEGFEGKRKNVMNKSSLRGVVRMSMSDAEDKEKSGKMPFEVTGYDFDDYVCKCFTGWVGRHCDISVSSVQDK